MDAIEVGKKLRELRGEESMESLAKKLGISQQAISMYENGERTPRDEVKRNYAEYYGTTIGALFYGE